VEKARKLFAEAGYPDGRGFPPVEALTITVQAKIIEFLHNHWQQNLGVDIRLKPVPVGELTLRLNSNRPDLILSGWQPTYPDPDNVLRVVVGRYSSWKNDTYYDLIQKARSIPDQAVRLVLYQKAEQILVDEAPMIPLNYARKQMLIKPWVKNWSRHWKDIVIGTH
jgi:ABC-type oligopeptide transport system substrate-binding subunit